MNLIFQKAKQSDLLLIQQLAQTIWHSHYPGIISKQQIDYMLNEMYSSTVIVNEINKGVSWIIVKNEAQPIGFISFQFDPLASKMKLSKLYILAQYHGKGIGAACLNFVKEEGLKVNAHKLFLTVNKQNTKAIEAYKRAGFFLEHEIVTDIGNGYVMDDYIMVFDLNADNQIYL